MPLGERAARRAADDLAVIREDARRARDQGRSLFMYHYNNRDSFVSAVVAMEAIEAEGWRLDQMSHYFDPHDGPVGVFVFRSSR
jgi:hypothetical protein